MTFLLNRVLLLLCLLSLAACGGGGSSGSTTPPAVGRSAMSIESSSAVSVVSIGASSVEVASSSESSSSSLSNRPEGEVTTTYSVTVEVPSSFISQVADNGATLLNSTNFAVIVVDLAGNVLQKVQLYADDVITKDGASWLIRFPSNPRADYLIAVDIAKPINVPVGSNIHQNDLMYAPITANIVDIDIGSTTGFSNFIEGFGGVGSFANQNFDPTSTANINLVEQVLNSIQDIVVQESLDSFTDVSTALASLKIQISNVAAQEILNLKHLTTGTAAGLIRDEGGMFTYQSFANNTVDDLNYDALIGMADLASYHFNGMSFVPATTSTNEQDLVLSSQGWVVPGNGTKVTSYNDDGSVLAELMGASGLRIKLEAEQVFDLSGRNVRDFLASNANTTGLATVVNASQTFASGAKGYRIKSRFLDRIYRLSVNAALDTAGICNTTDMTNGVAAASLGGNCNVVGLWGVNQQYLGTVSGLEEVLSPDVTPEMTGFQAVSLFDPIVVQIIDDSAKTARFYLQSPAASEGELPQTSLIGTGTWAQVTLPYLTEDATAIEVQMTNPLNDINYLLPSAKYMLIKQSGFVRFGLGIDDVISVNMSVNAAANESILGGL